MKMKSIFNKKILIAIATISSLSLQSCLDDDDNYAMRFPNALVTVKTDADQTVFLQLDDKTTLLLSENPENPYEVEFRHNAKGDIYGRYADGLVAFKLDALPDTEGKTVKLKLKWKSFSGEKSAEFDYCTRKSVTPESPAITSVRNSLNLQ